MISSLKVGAGPPILYIPEPNTPLLPLVIGKVCLTLKVGGLITITGLLPTSKGEDLDVALVMEVMCHTCSGTGLGLMKFLLIRISRLLHMGSTR
jgi:hypothetical protein